MIIKLNNEEKKITGKPFKKAEVKEMVKAYRRTIVDPKKEFKFAHFTVKEVLQLCIENNVLPESVLKLLKTPSVGSEYGVKIYMGKHVSENTCPTNRVPDYLGLNTAILCNTEVIKFKHYLDMLDDDKSISVPLVPDPGDAIDQATICPPDCPEETYPDPKDGYDLGA